MAVLMVKGHRICLSVYQKKKFVANIFLLQKSYKNKPVFLKFLLFCTNQKSFATQGQLFVVGGSNGHSDELNSGETYDPHTDEWIQVPELRTNRCNAG